MQEGNGTVPGRRFQWLSHRAIIGPERAGHAESRSIHPSLRDARATPPTAPTPDARERARSALEMAIAEELLAHDGGEIDTALEPLVFEPDMDLALAQELLEGIDPVELADEELAEAELALLQTGPIEVYDPPLSLPDDESAIELPDDTTDPLALPSRRRRVARWAWRATVRTAGATMRWGAISAAVIALLAFANDEGTRYLRVELGTTLYERYRTELEPPLATIVNDANARRIGTLAAPDALREPLDEIPRVFADALVRWEDARFYDHDGIDRIRLLGAFRALLEGSPQGGSTLTMQLAKLVKRDSARTLQRKFDDVALALALDAALPKSELLRLYADHAYFGAGVHGLARACRFYFAREGCVGLTLPEAAYLVALVKAPAELSKDDDRALARRDAVLSKLRPPPAETVTSRAYSWAVLGIQSILDQRPGGTGAVTTYTDADIDAAIASPLGLQRRREGTTHPFVLETARQELQDRLGSSLYSGGLDVRLTIDSRIQAAAERALTEGLDRLRALRKEEGAGADDLDGGLVVLDPRTGKLLAYVPGADFSQSQVPFAARPIQIGSSLKPFVYAELLETGNATLETMMLDAPLCLGRWCPGNYDRKYRGLVTLERALSQSLNTVAVRVAQQVGVDALVARLRLLGVTSSLTANLPMALGASELTLLELAGLYGALYDGRATKPSLIGEIHDRTGEPVLSLAPPERPRVYGPHTIEQLRVALAAVLGPGGTAFSLGNDLAAHFGLRPGERIGATNASPQMLCKTGTHDGFTRVGLGCLVSDTDVGPLAIVTYVGHRLPRSLGEGLTGGRIAGPIVGAFLKEITVERRAAGTFARFPALAAEPPEQLPLMQPRPDEPADAPIAALDAQGWPGARVANVDTFIVSGEDLVPTLVSAGREKDLDELAPLLGIAREKRTRYATRLLSPGFLELDLIDRGFILGERIAQAVTRIPAARTPALQHRALEDGGHVVVEVDGDRTTERTYRFLRSFAEIRIHREEGTRRLVALETVDGEGRRHAVVLRGGRLVPLTTRLVSVGRGSLEPAWIGAGLAPGQLDTLRSMIGTRVDIDRIPQGFTLDVLVAGGTVIGVRATAPSLPPLFAARMEGGCLHDDGVPCPRRLLPLPLAEARTYGRRGATAKGPIAVQRGEPGDVVSSPVEGQVIERDAAAGRIHVLAIDGNELVLEGLARSLAPGSVVRAGDPLGELDERGTIVLRDESEHASDVLGRLRPLETSSATLRSTVAWWRDRQVFLRDIDRLPNPQAPGVCEVRDEM